MNVTCSQRQSYTTPPVTPNNHDLPAFTRALIRAITEDELDIAHCPPLLQENYRCRIDPATGKLHRITNPGDHDAALAPIFVPTIVISLPGDQPSTKKNWARCAKVLQGRARRETWEGWEAYPPLRKGGPRRFAVEFRQDVWVGDNKRQARVKTRGRGRGSDGGEWRLETWWFCPQSITIPGGPGRPSRNVALRGNYVRNF